MYSSSNRYKKWIQPEWEKYFQTIQERPIHKKYTVHLLCQNNDEMVEEEVLATDGHDSFKVAEKEHDENCNDWQFSADHEYNVKWSCGSESSEFEEGWNSDND